MGWEYCEDLKSRLADATLAVVAAKARLDLTVVRHDGGFARGLEEFERAQHHLRDVERQVVGDRLANP